MLGANPCSTSTATSRVAHCRTACIPCFPSVATPSRPPSHSVPICPHHPANSPLLRTTRGRSSRLVRRAASGNQTSATTATAAAQGTEPISVWLRSREVEATVRLDVVAEGKGQAVVVVEVEPGSAAAESGIVRGQRLVGISDPVRDSEVWDLLDRPSLRFIRDTLKMRRMGQVQLVLKDYLNVTDPAWTAAAGSRSQSPAQGGRESSLGVAGASMDDGSSLPGRSGLDSMLSASEDEEGMTVGERMALQYERRERATRQVTEVKKRIERRAAYMDEVSQRNDSPLVAGLALAFLLPSVIILGIAAGTGYLDKLYAASLTIN